MRPTMPPSSSYPSATARTMTHAVPFVFVCLGGGACYNREGKRQHMWVLRWMCSCVYMNVCVHFTTVVYACPPPPPPPHSLVPFFKCGKFRRLFENFCRSWVSISGNLGFLRSFLLKSGLWGFFAQFCPSKIPKWHRLFSCFFSSTLGISFIN